MFALHILQYGWLHDTCIGPKPKPIAVPRPSPYSYPDPYHTCTQTNATPVSRLTPPVLLQVATLVKADWLFLLTDVDSLYTANPGSHPEAVRIPDVHDITKLQVRTDVMVVVSEQKRNINLLQCSIAIAVGSLGKYTSALWNSRGTRQNGSQTPLWHQAVAVLTCCSACTKRRILNTETVQQQESILLATRH